jgi:hypothetical protein
VADLKDLQKMLLKTSVEMPDVSIKVIRTEGLKFIKHNFRKQGFDTGSGVIKWKKRATLDKNGRNITRYRTSRVGKRGAPNKYGRTVTGRAILVGRNTGGNKLTNSFRSARRGKFTVAFRTYKEYAQRHNEGLDGMPERKFIGPSRYLDKKIFEKLKREHDKRLIK